MEPNSESPSLPGRPLTLGVVRYLNTRPLDAALAERPDVTLVPEVPSRLVERFRAGELDAALLPVMAWFEGVGAGIVRGLGIGSCGEVESVRLFCRRPLRETRVVCLDAESLTSNALCRILLRRAHGLAPEFATPTAAPAGADAVLRIGDKAMMDDPEAVEIVDLGADWLRWTGLPFVFAAWIAREGVPATPLVPILTQALAAGLARLPELAEAGARATGLDRGRCERYLSERIRYRFGPEDEDGLARFGEEARREGLIPRVRPVRWLA